MTELEKAALAAFKTLFRLEDAMYEARNLMRLAAKRHGYESRSYNAARQTYLSASENCEKAGEEARRLSDEVDAERGPLPEIDPADLAELD